MEPEPLKMDSMMRNLVEPELLTVEPIMWNLVEPGLLRMEPLCGTSRNLVPGFGRLPQTTPDLYWKNPKPFRLLGKNVSPAAWEVLDVLKFFFWKVFVSIFGGVFGLFLSFWSCGVSWWFS